MPTDERLLPLSLVDQCSKHNTTEVRPSKLHTKPIYCAKNCTPTISDPHLNKRISDRQKLRNSLPRTTKRDSLNLNPSHLLPTHAHFYLAHNASSSFWNLHNHLAIRDVFLRLSLPIPNPPCEVCFNVFSHRLDDNVWNPLPYLPHPMKISLLVIIVGPKGSWMLILSTL